MTPEISERSFEEAIECGLLAHGPDACAGVTGAVLDESPAWGDTPPGGYRKRRPDEYDRTLCLLPRDVIDFVLATQPKEWKRLEQHHGTGVKEQFLNFELYKRITDDRAFGDVLKNFLFDQYLRAHRNAEELIKRGESKTLEFKSTLRWSLKEDRKDDKVVTHAVLKTVAAFLNTEGGDLLIGVADDGSVVGIERDRFESDDRFMLHLAEVVRNALGDRAGTCIDPKVQIVRDRTVCVLSCQRSPEPVFLRWKGMEATPEGDFFVRSGPGTVKLPPDSAREYIRTRFAGHDGRGKGE